VYLTGLSRSVDPSDEEIEAMLDERYNLSNDTTIMWAGPGTTLIKRDDKRCCRGFGFLTFYSAGGAAIVIDRINANAGGSVGSGSGTCSGFSEGVTLLRAELSNPKAAKERKKSSGSGSRNELPDLRLRRQRKAPIRKHPVIVSSDGKKTNLGNKNR